MNNVINGTVSDCLTMFIEYFVSKGDCSETLLCIIIEHGLIIFRNRGSI